jgi:hypothetical protein
VEAGIISPNQSFLLGNSGSPLFSLRRFSHPICAYARGSPMQTFDLNEDYQQRLGSLLAGNSY